MSSYVRRQTPGDTEWFVHDRFGMFIHWGLYSMPARHEWIKSYEKMTEEKYDLYFKHFDPDLYDAREWAKCAKDAGMKYAVFTTKHHDGFCMFDSAYTDYKCTNTPAGRDLTREYVDAFRAEGLKVGFYYSLLDWHHPDYTIDCFHPRRDDPDAEAQNQKRDMHKYAQYMRDQVRELLTNYGKIDVLFFDFSFPRDPKDPAWMGGKGKDEWEAEKLIEVVRSLQPHIVVNGRTGLEQDLETPEQYQVYDWIKHKQTGELLTWEACQTFSGSWGYHRDENTWKSPEMLVQMLVNTVSEGGNLLLNVGPTSRGYFDSRAIQALDAISAWMKYHARAIYGCTKAEPEFAVPRGCRLTQSEDGKRLYLHLMEYPFQDLELNGYTDKVEYAQFLHDGSEILMKSYRRTERPDRKAAEGICLKLPTVKPNVILPVIELFLK